MKTYQVWFVNEDVLLLQADKTAASENLATFYVGHDLVAAFSFDQILGYCNVDSIVEADDDEDVEGE